MTMNPVTHRLYLIKSDENEITRKTLMLNAKIYCNHTRLFEFPIARRIFLSNYYYSLSISENDVKFLIVCEIG